MQDGFAQTYFLYVEIIFYKGTRWEKMKSKEIAKALDISEATVSLALNKRPGVSAKTVERIQKYIIF